MGYTTQRIDKFRGINRSLRPGAIDLSYAYNAQNVDIVGGQLTNKIGSYRCVYTADDQFDVPISKPNFLYIGSSDVYMITRGKYCKLADITVSGTEYGKFEPKAITMEDVVNDSGINIRGVGRSVLYANISDKDVMIASGMLDSESGGYWTYRDFYVDGPTAKTALYYLGSDTPTPKIHCRKFGSGLYWFKDIPVLSTTASSGGKLTSITIDLAYSSMEDRVKTRLRVDGVYLFASAIGANVDEDDIEKAYMWLNVTSVESGTGGKAKLNVSTTHLETDVRSGSYAYLRGGCSDMPITFMTMYYGRLFASTHRSAGDHPLRLYWSCLPGDGRTIEDWTLTDASVDTSGGHVDIGDPSDGYITGLIACGSQLLIFTQTRLWRLYGTAPSNYTLEKVCEINSARISNVFEHQGSAYWLSWSGIQCYNGSYVTTIDDNDSTRHLLDSFPQYMREAFMYSTIHGEVFDNSIIFAFDATAHKTSRGGFVDEHTECWILRYNLHTGDTTIYIVPCDNFRQQFISVLTRNFGIDGGNVIRYESRLIQTLVHKTQYDPDDPLTIITPEYMVMTQWHQWQNQDFGWYDNLPLTSLWQSGWTDMQSPEIVKKVHTICLRGSGEFMLTIESEHNKDVIEVKMPENEYTVKELSPHHAEGRSFRITIESKKPFAIEPYMTLMYDIGGKR